MEQTLSIVILAAGKGSRMKSSLPKVMHKVANREMLNLVIDGAKILKPSNITVVLSEDTISYKDQIQAAHQDFSINFVVQKEQKGTAHALVAGVKSVEKVGSKVLVLYGDTPLLSYPTLNMMVESLNDSQLSVLAFDCFEPNNYGRVIIDEKGIVDRIVETKDASLDEQKVTLCNSGVMSMSKSTLSLIKQIKNENKSGEYYLTDLVKIAKENSLKVSCNKSNQFEVLGVNSKLELATVEKIAQNQLRLQYLDAGVTMIDPDSVYFSFDTLISSDVTIYPNVYFGPGVRIANSVTIKSFSDIEGADIDSGSVIGPFARIRPGTKINKNVKIGNFVEIKAANISDGAKVSHLSYIGDSEVGKNSNIGAGVITCNYDGKNKHKTTIGEDCFIGSNSALVAPVIIANKSLIGAGSVITKNVEEGDLAIARSKQVNLAGKGNK